MEADGVDERRRDLETRRFSAWKELGPRAGAGRRGRRRATRQQVVGLKYRLHARARAHRAEEFQRGLAHSGNYHRATPLSARSRWRSRVKSKAGPRPRVRPEVVSFAIRLAAREKEREAAATKSAFGATLYLFICYRAVYLLYGKPGREETGRRSGRR